MMKRIDIARRPLEFELEPSAFKGKLIKAASEYFESDPLRFNEIIASVRNGTHRKFQQFSNLFGSLRALDSVRDYEIDKAITKSLIKRKGPKKSHRKAPKKLKIDKKH